MKSTLLASAVLSLSALTACGGSDPVTPHTFQPGTFALSNVKAVDGDQCQLLSTYGGPGEQIKISEASDNTLSFRVPLPSLPDNEDPATAVLSGNDLLGPKPADYAQDKLQDGCQPVVKETLTGQLAADDTLQLQMEVVETDGSDTPGTCTAEDLHAAAVPCTSTLSFTAKRTGP